MNYVSANDGIRINWSALCVAYWMLVTVAQQFTNQCAGVSITDEIYRHGLLFIFEYAKTLEADEMLFQEPQTTDDF